MIPLHPAIVHLPIALVILSVITDLLGYLSGAPGLSATGFWSLVGATAGAALALPSGLFDMVRQHLEHEAHHRVHRHMKVGFTLFAALTGLGIWRWLIYRRADPGPGPGYLFTAVIVLGLAAFQGWLGGRLVFFDGVGVQSHGSGQPPPEASSAEPGGHGAH